jgi:diketogulonate reductase-like aldo/keto reductase
VGRALEEKFAAGVVKREDIFITSKLWNNFHRPELVKKGVQESLEKLKLKSLDLCVFLLFLRRPRRPGKSRATITATPPPPLVPQSFLIHFPVSFRPDVTEATSADEVESVPLEDTWRAMEALVDEGLVTNIGVSNFEIEHLQRVQAVAYKPIGVNLFESQP